MRIKIKSKKLLSLLLCFTMLLGAGSVMASAETSVVDMTEGLKALTETTNLPAKLKGTIGDEDILYTNPKGYNVYADLYKFEVSASQSLLTVNQNGGSVYVDLYYWLFKANGDSVVFVDGSDNELHFELCLEEAGTYYLAVAGWRGYCVGEYDISVSLTEITDEVYDVEEALLTVTETTALPTEFDYELGSEDIRYYDGYAYAYGKLIKVEVKEDNTLLKVKFKGDSKETETYIYVYKLKNDGEGDYLDEIDSDSDSVSPIVDSGTYYIALLGYDTDDEGNCHAKISAEKAVIKNMTDALAELTETTSLPAEFDYELGSDNTLYIDPEDEMVYAKLIKFSVDKGNTLLTSYFGGKVDDVDTYTWLFKQNNDNTVSKLKSTDDDDLGYKIEEPGTYYLALAGYGLNDIGECMAEINTYSLDDAASLDFTDSENLPVPGEDDKWSWDEATKTLTLKDGFSLLGYTESSYAAITLPDDSTVFVEGKADIMLISDSAAIGSFGKLTVKGSGAETSKLNIEAPKGLYCGILSIDITIEDVTVNANKVSEGILSINSVIIRNAEIGLSGCDIG
ncbi:MAG: PPC domain-containing protein, partial [Acutalibacteraceae bacterium]